MLPGCQGVSSLTGNWTLAPNIIMQVDIHIYSDILSHLLTFPIDQK